MRIKEFKTFEYYETKELWCDEKIMVDLDKVSYVKEYKGLISKSPFIEVCMPGGSFLIEMSYKEFCDYWIVEKE